MGSRTRSRDRRCALQQPLEESQALRGEEGVEGSEREAASLPAALTGDMRVLHLHPFKL